MNYSSRQTTAEGQRRKNNNSDLDAISEVATIFHKETDTPQTHYITQNGSKTMLDGFFGRRPSVLVVEGIQRGQQVREKISHKTSALLNTHDSFHRDKKYKYHQLYQTFKRSLGIREDIRDKDEFDAAFSTLISQIDKSKAGALKEKEQKKVSQLDMQVVENDRSS